jgi:copper chaperone CopZ
MTCDGCVKAVSESLFKLGGITKVDADLAGQLVSVEGTGTLKDFLVVSVRGHHLAVLEYH